MVYREPPATELSCPRCKKKKLPPVDVAACTCGTWVTTFVADVVLTERDRTPNRGTRWWRVLEPCPVCKDKMKLHGQEPGLLLGCEGHGYWIDADTIAHTGLARPIDQAVLERKREDASAIETDRENRERAEHQRAQDKAERERAEAAVRQMTTHGGVDSDVDFTPSRAVAEAEFLLTLDPILRSLWTRVAALEQKNAELARRVAVLEQSAP